MDLDDLLGWRDDYVIRSSGAGPRGRLPLTDELLRTAPSGDLFGMTQAVGMGWDPADLDRPQVMVLSTSGGLRAPDGSPVALGLHTGHWEVGLLVERAARRLRDLGAMPFSATVTDPCDGRSQGTTGMLDSLPYRNDAATVMRRLVRSLPQRRAVVGVATCDKGLPAMMMALAGSGDVPVALVPGGVTLPAVGGEDLGTVQSIGARYAHGELTLARAAEVGCTACGSAGGGCQFLGTAATAQVVAEALGLALPHTALAPSGQPIWLASAAAAAAAVLAQRDAGLTGRDVVCDAAIRNAMVVHAAVGGSTNLLLHVPAIAHAAGLRRPTVDDWAEVNAAVPRLVQVLPNGPVPHPTVRVFQAGGVPEVMLRLAELDLLDLTARTATGGTLGDALAWWQGSDRRRAVREGLAAEGVDPDDVIMSADRARRHGLTSTITFPRGNLAPEGAVIKSTAIDPAVVDADGVYRHRGRARVFVREADAIAAIKGQGDATPVRPGDVVVLGCGGPLGTGMEEIYQITSALKHVSWGKQVAVVTDARFSGVSTGACIGHVAPEALAGGPIGCVLDGDLVEIEIDRVGLTGRLDLVGDADTPDDAPLTPQAGAALLAARGPRPDLAPHPRLPDDTRIWAALQQLGGGPWGGCVYDADAIVAASRG